MDIKVGDKLKIDSKPCEVVQIVGETLGITEMVKVEFDSGGWFWISKKELDEVAK